MIESVLLIPGFFGFGTFGDRAGHTFSYFAEVARALERAHPGRFKGGIAAHEPPPTGSLASRVASLHARVRDLVASGIERVHLVGHSAGGVDARLFANVRFAFPGAPSESDRAALLARIGSIVTLSSPFFGTPIAVRLRTDRDALLVGVQALSIASKAPDAPLLARAALLPYALLAHALHRDPLPGNGVTRLLTHLDRNTVTQIRRFFAELESDRSLLDDLTPARMSKLTQGLAESDRRGIKSFVSVSPPPRLGLDDVVPRALYRRAYDGTRDGRFLPNGWPPGPWIGPRSDAREHEVCPNDGVVPVGSQTIDGRAAGIVLADHLDVVGHYQGSANGAVVFKSDARFDRDRFETLWSAIAAAI